MMCKFQLLAKISMFLLLFKFTNNACEILFKFKRKRYTIVVKRKGDVHEKVNSR